MDSQDFDALEDAARAVLSPESFIFCQTGAADEITARENVMAWRLMRLRPRVLRDIQHIDTTTTLLGQPVATPILVAPTGRHRLFHPHGEQATAQGAAMAGAAYVVATSSTVALGEIVAERAGAPLWFQLYLGRDRPATEALLDRLEALGFGAIVFTVDQPLYGWSPRSARTPIVPSADIRHMNLPGQPIARTAYDAGLKGVVMFPTVFDDLAWLVGRTKLPVVVKGVLRADDARRCVELGARAIAVSNHGGRHLDTAITTAEALPEIVDAVSAHAEIYVDGGLRRGTDILKALALGARAVMIGRPVLWGLATGGAEGVSAVLTHLHGDLAMAMALSGVPALAEATPDLVHR